MQKSDLTTVQKCQASVDLKNTTKQLHQFLMHVLTPKLTINASKTFYYLLLCPKTRDPIFSAQSACIGCKATSVDGVSVLKFCNTGNISKDTQQPIYCKFRRTSE